MLEMCQEDALKLMRDTCEILKDKDTEIVKKLGLLPETSISILWIGCKLMGSSKIGKQSEIVCRPDGTMRMLKGRNYCLTFIEKGYLNSETQKYLEMSISFFKNFCFDAKYYPLEIMDVVKVNP